MYYKLIFVDGTMNGMSGIKCIENILSIYKNTKVFIVALTGDSDEKTEQNFYKSGANLFLVKPITK